MNQAIGQVRSDHDLRFFALIANHGALPHEVGPGWEFRTGTAAMEYRTLGTSDLRVSLYGLGAMTFGSRGPRGLAKVDSAGADALVGAALDAGVTLFDTADIYHGGESEILLGQALRGRRDGAVLVTKVGLRSGREPAQTGLSAGHIARSVDASLKRLGTDRIDLYLAHRIDPAVSLEETLTAFDRLIRSGKVGHIGISNWPAWLATKAIALQKSQGWQPFIAGQVCYSLVDRDVEHEITPSALSEGYGLMVYSPLAMGRLTGKYDSGGPAIDGRLTTFEAFSPPDADRLDRVLATLRVIAVQRQASMAQVALAWLATRPGVATILIGASNPAQLTANLASADLLLNEDEVARLNDVSAGPRPYPMSALDAALSREDLARYLTANWGMKDG